MADSEVGTITALLTELRGGNRQAEEELLARVYQELRRMAQQQLHKNRALSLEATELVHLVYLRLFKGAAVDFENRAHFFGIAARQMRRLLIEQARERGAHKRGGQLQKLPLTEAQDLGMMPNLDLLALDEALERCARLYPRAVRIVELRYFAGLTEAETAEVLGISVTTLKREWGFAKVWLLRQLGAAAQ